MRLGRRGELTIRATHLYVKDPQVEQALDVWAQMLAEAIRRQACARIQARERPPQEGEGPGPASA